MASALMVPRLAMSMSLAPLIAVSPVISLARRQPSITGMSWSMRQTEKGSASAAARRRAARAASPEATSLTRNPPAWANLASRFLAAA